ncbi:MAG: hypothetical protein R2874_00925 [Desulfobacterales bacterium]
MIHMGVGNKNVADFEYFPGSKVMDVSQVKKAMARFSKEKGTR